MEVAKKSFLVARPLKGGGDKGRATKNKDLFETIFVTLFPI